jgi:hypothetical protein
MDTCGKMEIAKHKQVNVVCKMPTKNTSPHKTKDIHIRKILLSRIKRELLGYTSPHLIVEELGVNHGAARVDVAVVNGVLHGYEIKSDLDTLLRLPEQVNAYNEVFDKMTIVAGLSHLHEAIYVIPDWWGIIVAREDSNGKLLLNDIRKPHVNRRQDRISLAKLLWREEAMRILEDCNEAVGLYSKPRKQVYIRLAEVMNQKELGDKVRESLCLRGDWRAGGQLVPNGG